MHWAVQYIGMKHEAGARGPDRVDCWGLLCLVYRNQFKIPLPDFPNISVEGLCLIRQVIKKAIETDWDEVSIPFDGAAVAMSQSNNFHHVGIYTTADGGKIVHCWDAANVIVDTRQSLTGKGFRLIKFYRHKLWPISLK